MLYNFRLWLSLDAFHKNVRNIVQGAKKLQQFYETDIDENTFTQECIMLAAMCIILVFYKMPRNSI